MNFHDDPIDRQRLIASYVRRRLDPAAADAFEAHYLECDPCFQELRAADLLVAGLERRRLGCRRVRGVTVLSFTRPAELVCGSEDLRELARNVLEQKDSKVVIDMSRVSRIDSAGLGELMRMYTHLIRSHGGALKVLNPSGKVQTVLRITRIDSVVELYHDEESALESFERT